MLAVIITLILLFAIFGAGAYWVFKNTNVYTTTAPSSPVALTPAPPAPTPTPTPAPTPAPTPSVEPFYSFSPSASSANRHSVVGGCCGLGV